MPEMTPRAFSFNSPHGACTDCQGLGVVKDFDPARIVPDSSRSLLDGAIEPWVQGDKKLVREALLRINRKFKVPLDKPFRGLPKKMKELLFYGRSEVSRRIDNKEKKSKRSNASRKRESLSNGFEGIVSNMRTRYEAGDPSDQATLEPYRALLKCDSCQGERLKPHSRGVTVKGRTISEYVRLAISDVLNIFSTLELTDREHLVSGRIIREILERLRFLDDVGVGYLSLDRSAATLSGGEGQRIRLATQIGAKLVGVLYVLDEPSIGLHQRDNRLLRETLASLRDLGNTVIVGEHD